MELVQQLESKRSGAGRRSPLPAFLIASVLVIKEI
jgi:hypothetical protein